MMKDGSNLLKHLNDGYPHIRFFQLSDDCDRIIWYSSSHTIDHSIIKIASIEKLEIGQKSVKFLKHPLKGLKHLSFSLYYKNPKLKGGVDTLDLTCKDEYEFDFWIAGFKAILYLKRGMDISKNDLLKHSRIF